ncbi:MAG TPA: amino acid adenylation domain-containing protein [Streptosporangiaceae bacterium]|jgi:amino acid adenylation domain-containing protein
MLNDTQRAALAARLRRDRAAHLGPDGVAEAAGRITRRPPELAEPPATFGQEQLWFLDRFAPGQAAYNLLCPVRVTGPLDAAALGRSVDALLARHEALRTRIVPAAAGHPVQLIDPPSAVGIETLDYAGREDAWTRLTELAADELRAPFDLSEGPLLRARLVALAPDDHLLLVTVHHAVFDGHSAGVLLRDLAALYAAHVTGTPAGLPELPVQFADYACWERQRLAGDLKADLEDYWRRALTGFEVARLPADRPRPSVDSVDGAEESRTLPAGLLRDLRELSRREGTTLFVTLLAAFQALLHRYTGQTDIVVGTTSANRSRAVLDPLIGFLVNTLPIRADLSGDPTFTELLDRVKQATTGAYGHQDLPFSKIVEALRVPRDASRLPLIQLMFNLVEAPGPAIPAAGAAFALAGKLSDAYTAKFDISLFGLVGEELTFQAVYSPALFDAATIQQLLSHLEVLLHGVSADPAARLSQLPVLTGPDLHRELTEWNDTAMTLPGGCLHQGFEAQAAATPHAIAVELGDGHLPYGKLNLQANQIARRLRAAGVGPEVLTGVCLPPSPRRIAALLGILKAGGGYVPLDPALPPERMAFMVADAGLSVVLADESTLASLPPTTATVLCLDAEQATLAELDGTDLDCADLMGGALTPANVAYVIYTSGSTGRPKGVVVEHRQAVNFVYGMIHQFRIGPADATLQFASLSFDVSVMDMFLPLLAGGRVVLVPPQAVQSPPRLAALINQAGVTYACLTPSVLSLLTGYDFPRLRSLVSGGEELPSELAAAWLRPGLGFYNTYGPTEAAVVTTWIRLDAATQPPPPIGRPLPNYQAYVLDEQLNPVPPGVTGELHVGGAGVARGYLNRSELTRERFIPDPFRGRGRLYKTGDLVRRRPDGTIVFLGRADTQVKIHGLRIELGEIEAELLAYPDVAQAVVTVVPGPGADKQLAAYLRPAPGATLDPARLRAHCATTLPASMVPAHLVAVDAFPLNTSGKIDRAALPAPGQSPARDNGRGGGPVPPATFLETVLTGLYATVLDLPRAGATDSFFDLGGSSLQVMRLVDLISRDLGVDVGVATIFLHPAPRQLAARIDALRSGIGEPGAHDSLIELANGVGELPLLLIHAVGGTVFSYAQLAAELSGVFRVRGLEAPGLGPDGVTGATLAALADDYSARLLAAQPDGPYRLAGWSMGGVIAFEVARRLEQAGHQVASLVLLDAPFAMPDHTAPAQAELAGRFLADAARSLGWDATPLPDPAAATADEQLAWLAGRLDGGAGGRRDGGDTDGGTSAGAAAEVTALHAGPGAVGAGAVGAGASGVAARLRRRFEVFGGHVQLLAGYEPQVPAVRAPTLIVSATDSPNAPAAAHWPRVLAGPVATMPVAGDHYTFLRPPLVTEVAASILKWHDGSG